jgi:ribosomal protein L11 methyltransferase
MSWQQLRLQTSSALAEDIEQLLLDHGALSVSLDDAQDQQLFQTEPGATPLWDSVRLSGLFADDIDLQSLVAALEQRLVDQPNPAISVENLEDQDWETIWMDRFQPMQFGQRLWICPSWTSPPQPEAVNILLDPGLAFGTGTHPTTALCLEWLEQQDLHGRLVVDYGCGSGVLAIAAALLGAQAVVAVDNDPQAILASEANRDINQLDSSRLSVCLPENFPPDPSSLPADVLLANILAGPLEELAPGFASMVRPGGNLVLSGILPEQAPGLHARYQRWFEMSAPSQRDGWTRLCGTRRYS